MSLLPPRPITLAVALLACRSVAPPPVTHAPSARPAITLAASAPRLSRAPGVAGVAGLRALMGGRRVELAGSRAQVSDDAIFDEVVVAAECARGWVFVSAAGMILASDSYTGPLRRLGDLPLRADAMNFTPWTRGRVALADGRRLWVTDGATLTGPQTLPERVRAVAFADERRGVASLQSGAALVTRDGGTTWHPMEGLREPLRGLVFDGRVLRVRTAQGERSLLLDGTLAAAPEPVDPPADEVQRARAWAIALAWYRAQGACVGGVQLRDGSCVAAGEPWRNPRPGDAFAMGPARDVWLPRADAVYAFSPERGTHEVLLREEHCATRPLHRGAAILCRHAWQTDDGATLRLLPMPQGLDRDLWPEQRAAGRDPSDERGRDLIPSASGAVAVAQGRCTSGGTFIGSDSHACVFDARRGTNRELPFPPGARWRIESVSDEALLLRGVDSDGSSRRVALPLDGGVPRDVTIEGGLAVDGLTFTRDGVLHGVARDGERSFLVRGDLTTPLRRVALPLGTTAARLRDARFGVACGPSLDALWRTRDGGDSWLRVTLPVDGAYPDGRDDALPLACDDARCAVGPLSLPEEDVALPPRPLAFAPRRLEPPPGDAWSLVGVRCVREAHPSGDDSARARGAEGVMRPEGLHAWAMAHADEGAALIEAPDHGVTCLVGTSARAALLGFDGGLRWVTGPTSSAQVEFAAGIEADACARIAALPLPDGGVLLGAGCGNEASGRCAEGLQLDAAGAATGRLRVDDDGPVLRGVGRVGEASFVAAIHPGGRVELSPLDPAVARPDLPLLPRSPARCGVDADAPTATLQVIARSPITLDAFHPARSLDRVTFELRRGAWCLRALASLWWDAPPLPRAVGLDVRATASALVGAAGMADDRVRVRCEVAP